MTDGGSILADWRIEFFKLTILQNFTPEPIQWEKEQNKECGASHAN